MINNIIEKYFKNDFVFVDQSDVTLRKPASAAQRRNFDSRIHLMKNVSQLNKVVIRPLATYIRRKNCYYVQSVVRKKGSMNYLMT